MKVAIIHDWFTWYSRAERVIKNLDKIIHQLL